MTNQLQELFEKIEDFDFRFYVNQATGFRMFKRLVRGHDTYVELKDILRKNTELKFQSQIQNRILQILSIDIDPNYENPYDSALAAYLMILEATQIDYIESVAIVVAQQSQLWWAEKVANEIIAIQYTNREKAGDSYHFSGERYIEFGSKGGDSLHIGRVSPSGSATVIATITPDKNNSGNTSNQETVPSIWWSAKAG